MKVFSIRKNLISIMLFFKIVLHQDIAQKNPFLLNYFYLFLSIQIAYNECNLY